MKKDMRKTKAQLVEELDALREKINAYEKLEKKLKVKESALKKCDERFQAIFDNTIVGIDIIDHSGEFVLVNRSLADMLGYTVEELSGLTITDITPKEDRNRSDESLFKLVKGEARKYHLDKKFLKKDGTIFWADLSVSIIENPPGEIDYIIGIVVDANKRKESEQKIQEYIELLESKNRVIEEHVRNLDFLNTKLLKSEAELKESNASKDKFFSIIAHDLKVPFTSFLGFTDYLATEIGDLTKEEINMIASQMNRSAHNVFNLLENLLHWARMQTDKIPFEPRIFHLNDALENIIPLFEPVAAKKGISLDIPAYRDLELFADQQMLQTIIRNLVSNAIKFTNTGGTVSLRAEEKKEFIQISVNDTGVGMDEKVRKKLFALDKGLTTLGTSNEKGTGLGLILCKEFVEKHKGTIFVESSPGKGSSFIFRLPKNG